MMLARTAAQFGALCANSTRAVGFLREGDHVVGVRAKDLDGGREFEIRAQQVINAAGVWTDEIQEMLGGRGQFRVRASKGVHIVVPRNRINSATGIIGRTAKSVLFIVPWGSHWIIGTTDTDWQLDLAHPAASQKDIDYLLEQANRLLADPLTREDVVGVYAGLRPLLAGESDSTSKLSREHAVASPVRGLNVIAGGKYTTYRVMAKDAVDSAVHGLERSVPSSITEDVPLAGADGYHALWNSRRLVASRSGLRVGMVEHLLGRYGSLINEVLALIAERPELGEPLAGAPEYLQGRGAVRRHARGRAASRGRADPPHPHLDRGPRPRRVGRARDRRAHRAGAGMGRHDRGRRARALRPARGRRARVAAPERRPHRGRGPSGCVRRPPRFVAGGRRAR